MKDKKFSDIILELRKEKGLTQQELAKKLNITDKAVSKWERGLSYPDITSISSLANILGVDSSYLIDLCKKEDSNNPFKKDFKSLIDLILIGIGLAMGIAVVVLNLLSQIDEKNSISMLGIGLFCISLSLLNQKNN